MRRRRERVSGPEPAAHGERVARGAPEQGGAVVRLRAAVVPNRNYVLRVSARTPPKDDPLAGYTVILEDS